MMYPLHLMHEDSSADGSRGDELSQALGWTKRNRWYVGGVLLAFFTVIGIYVDLRTSQATLATRLDGLSENLAAHRHFHESGVGANDETRTPGEPDPSTLPDNEYVPVELHDASPPTELPVPSSPPPWTGLRDLDRTDCDVSTIRPATRPRHAALTQTCVEALSSTAELEVYGRDGPWLTWRASLADRAAVLCECQATSGDAFPRVVTVGSTPPGQVLDLDERTVRALRPGDRTVRLRISVVPDGATVTLHRMRLADVPFEARVIRSADRYHFHVWRRGYRPVWSFLSAESNNNFELELQRE